MDIFPLACPDNRTISLYINKYGYTYSGTFKYINPCSTTIVNYDYTGGQQSFVVPTGCTGKYKLEVWGASGGNYNTTNHRGGYGGYAMGVVTLSAGTTIYVNVGQRGVDNTTYGTLLPDTYNGGGQNGANPGGAWIGSSGGGATHMAFDSGVLATLSSHATDGRILIVAGGGGGASYATNGNYYYGSGTGGDGGGYSGGTGTGRSYDDGYYSGVGGTQTSGGTGCEESCFGTARISKSTNQNCGHGGGGGGYYGGASGFGPGGGGGSGYIASANLITATVNGTTYTKHMYGYSISTSTTASIRTNTGTCVETGATADCAKTGNGYAKITFLTSE